MTDTFGRALADHYRGERTAPLIQRDGEERLEHPIEEFYFTDFDPAEHPESWMAEHLSGPLVDLGAGVGRHSLYFQERFETVAVEVSEPLVSVMDDRAVERTEQADMFTLREHFEPNRFTSALAWGTQVGLAATMDGLRTFLSDLAIVTTPDATALVDSYDPQTDGVEELLGYRAVPTPGLAHRVFWFEYEGTAGDTLLFQLFSPEKFREATVGTPWTMAEVLRPNESSAHYLIRLEKENGE